MQKSISFFMKTKLNSRESLMKFPVIAVTLSPFLSPKVDDDEKSVSGRISTLTPCFETPQPG